MRWKDGQGARANRRLWVTHCSTTTTLGKLALQVGAGDDDDTVCPSRRRPWAWLLRHVWEADISTCVRGGGPCDGSRSPPSRTSPARARRACAKNGIATVPRSGTGAARVRVRVGRLIRADTGGSSSGCGAGGPASSRQQKCSKPTLKGVRVVRRSLASRVGGRTRLAMGPLAPTATDGKLQLVFPIRSNGSTARQRTSACETPGAVSRRTGARASRTARARVPAFRRATRFSG